MNFAKRLFLFAGVSGLFLILPMYFMEDRIGRDTPPAVTHPEFYYGFLGVAAAWQVAFLVIARDPARFRPLMIPAVLEKATFGFAAIALFLAGRAPGMLLGFALLTSPWASSSSWPTCGPLQLKPQAPGRVCPPRTADTTASGQPSGMAWSSS
jgi:hypothetical protein